jgi:hypothetical protein
MICFEDSGEIRPNPPHSKSRLFFQISQSVGIIDI